MTQTSDFLVVGAGIIGFAIARELRRQLPDCSITILEKEKSVGLHASGRNSGVLHAGFYYSKDSFKAKFTRDGNLQMREYCLTHGLSLNDSGKLVVASSEDEVAGLEELYRRARVNGIDASLITAKEAQALEPRIRTIEKALFSPTTASVNPCEVMQALERELLGKGVDIETGVAYRSTRGRVAQTSKGEYEAGHLINAAGLYADRIAHGMGFGEQYRIIPFKGLYLYANPHIGQFRRHIYPVPNLQNPFLGVHFTLTADGRVKIGPTAIPALWREQYTGVGGFSFRELAEVTRSNIELFRHDYKGYIHLATEEIRKYFKKYIVANAARMATGVEPSMFSKWGSPGIRAQLLDTETHALVNDFAVEGDDRSTHILNAVSPAFTCAFPFAEYVVNGIIKRLN
jgi:L-2-hydroxyglutarate oxidase LhgO